MDYDRSGVIRGYPRVDDVGLSETGGRRGLQTGWNRCRWDRSGTLVGVSGRERVYGVDSVVVWNDQNESTTVPYD